MIPFQRQRIKFSHRISVSIPLDAAHGQCTVYFDQFVAALIRDAEFKRCAFPVRRYDGMMTVNDLRVGARKPCKEQPCCQCKTQQPCQCFERYQNVCSKTVWICRSIPDRGNSLHAKKEIL